ncbi:MAG: mnmG 1 [Clostridia bacterium]|jgi:hypothetical protein|nr:mnmG 1 [Clostridia bacterium]
MKYINMQYDVVVVGGGMAGICAAIASARGGAQTALIQDRPVLGGNASSEVRMHICGANIHGNREDARETGIIEEILLENRKRNPNHSFSILDTVLWEKVNFQENLDLYLNTRMIDVESSHNEITSITAHQLTTEKDFLFKAKIFIDCSGDSSLAYKAGANFRVGRESKDEFGEQFAPDKADSYTMGNTIMFKAIDMGYEIAFERPEWAYTFTEDDLRHRGHSAAVSTMEHYGIDSGYWWIELGGMQDTIKDAEEIRDELLKTVYGIWDHIKNAGDHGAQNYALEWVQFLPGKRESRRIEGDYLLKGQDALAGKVFEDAVAYGGWPMDMHPPEGFHYKGDPTNFIEVPIFTIPYRSYYSKNIDNLMMAGRNISATHMAFGSIRVMATCAIGGQAAGTAAAMAINYHCTPREIGRRIETLQQTLLKDDCYIPGFKNEDVKDKALQAKVMASSQIAGGEAEQVINGVSRKVEGQANCWISNPISKEGQWIQLDLNGEETIREIHIKFDSNLTSEIVTSLSKTTIERQQAGLPGTLVKEYEIQILKQNAVVWSKCVQDNYLRFNKHYLLDEIAGDTLKIIIKKTYGCQEARVFEVRVY